MGLELQLINNFGKVAGYKINSSKSVAFLYSKDKQAEKVVREMTPFTIATNHIKYLGMTLTKQVKDLYDKKLGQFDNIRRSKGYKLERKKSNYHYLQTT